MPLLFRSNVKVFCKYLSGHTRGFIPFDLHRLGSHLSPTETACYLTADLFYLEVLLKPDGGVEDVKVALHGEPPLVCSALVCFTVTPAHQTISRDVGSCSPIYASCLHSEFGVCFVLQSSALLLQLLR